MNGRNDGLSPVAQAYRAAAPWLAAVWQFVGFALLGVAAGWGIDRWLQTGPYGLAGGGFVGSGLGFVAFIRTTTKLLEKKQ